MAFVPLRQGLDHASEHGYGVPAFNVNNLEQIQAIMKTAQDGWAILAGVIRFAGFSGMLMVVCLPSECRETQAECGLTKHSDAGVRATITMSWRQNSVSIY